jgi:hypothetical protein
MRARIRGFFAFWYDFIVGDDWRVAVGVAVALAVTYGISRTSVPAWWVLPVAVAGLLSLTVWRTVRSDSRP